MDTVAHRRQHQWMMNNSGSVRKAESTIGNPQTVFIESPQSDPDFRGAGWLLELDAGHFHVSVEAAQVDSGVTADIRSGAFTINVTCCGPPVTS